MPSNRACGRQLERIAALAQLAGRREFEVAAYARAGRTVSGLKEPLADLVAAGAHTGLPGIGRSLGRDLAELATTGRCETLDRLVEEVGAGVAELLTLPGLGAARVAKLRDALGVRDLAGLERALATGAVASTSGLGAKLATQLATALAARAARGDKAPYPTARRVADHVAATLRRQPGIGAVETVGAVAQIRPWAEKVELLAATTDVDAVLEALAGLGEVEPIRGGGSCDVEGARVAVRAVAPDALGARVLWETSSERTRDRLASAATARGLRLDATGLWDAVTEVPVATPTVEAAFAALSIAAAPPAWRAFEGEDTAFWPALSSAHVLGDLHMHTTWSDGAATIEEMRAAAADRGRRHIVITDHSVALAGVANGLDAARVRAQIAAIRALPSGECRVLCGLEVDILRDGALDLDDETLGMLDWAVGSIHSAFSLTRREQTARLLRAIESGWLGTIGHPTGQKLGSREGIEFDVDAVLDACEEHGVGIEINGSPHRLDASDELLAAALARPGLWISLGSDAHSVDELDQVDLALAQAARAGVPPGRLVNSLDADALVGLRRGARA
ncbi:MAG: PHP domain-containing protein [Myxococcales bacterium]|nr:PHP domain-containing protein [Myxococcales bacterium]MCB9520328.1 PHP domain-containing protein [Myxococcales bacterium]MCB9530991.1 PHP domain-containing protein [Myxococcales bacterium]MCB9532911.1 PHP domain-containing protein [Myxococcales bacterium]